jgi:ABC-2 type transport system permease protein
MKKIFLVLRYELSKAFNRRSYVFVGFGIPLIAVLIVAAVAVWRRDSVVEILPVGEEVKEFEIEGYVDLTGLISTIPEDLPQDIFVAYPSEDAAAQALNEGEIYAYYIIPEDYLEQGTVIYVNTGANPFESDSQEWMMRWTLLVEMLGGDLEFASLVLNPVDLTVERRGEETSPDRYSEEDCSRPGPACRSNPLIEMLPMIGLGTAGLLQSGVWIGALWTMLRIGGGVMSLPPEFHLPVWLIAIWLLYFLLGYALYASLMAGIGALVPDVRAGSQASGLVMIPLIIGYMLSVMPFSVEDPNGILVTTLSLFPLTSPVAMVMRMTVTAVPLWQLALSLGLLVITVILVLRAVGKIFRTQMILSGQPFTVRRYLRALLA